MEQAERITTDGSMSKMATNTDAKSSLADINSQYSSSGTIVELKRSLGLAGGSSVIIGTIIGSGIFLSPKGVTEGAGSVALALIIWVICGFIATLGALCFAELGAMIQESGAEYAYMKRTFGNGVAFTYSWTYCLLVKPCSLAIVIITCAQYLTVPFFDDDCGDPPKTIIILTGITVIMILGAINIYSVQLAADIMIIFTVVKVIALLIIIGIGIIRLIQGYTDVLATGFDGSTDNAGDIMTALYSGLWAYGGWSNLNFVTEEIINPGRNLPLSIGLSLPFITLLYVLANVSYFTVMSVEEMLDSSAVAITWANEAMSVFSWTMPLFVAASTFGAGDGALFTTGRLCFVAGRDGHLPEVLCMLHVKRLSPSPAIIFTAILGIFFVLPYDIGGLLDLFNFATWLFYLLAFIALLMLRYTMRDAPRPFKVNILIPIFMIAVAIFLTVFPFIVDFSWGLVAAAIFILLGGVVYVIMVHLNVQPPMDAFTMMCQLWLSVVRPELEVEEPKED